MSNLSFQIRTPEGMNLPVEEVTADMTVKELVDQAVNFIEFPIHDDNGKEIEYFLENSKGARLQPQDTLAQAGVQRDEVLTLKSSSAIAGRGVGERPLPPPPPAGMVNVYVQLMDLNRTELETIPVTKKVGDVLNDIIRKHRLPARDEKLKEGKVYELFSKAAGEAMHESVTLREAKIPNLDTFIISTTEIPG